MLFDTVVFFFIKNIILYLFSFVFIMSQGFLPGVRNKKRQELKLLVSSGFSCVTTWRTRQDIPQRITPNPGYAADN